MVNFIATFITLLIFILPVVAIAVLIILAVKKLKKEKPKADVKEVSYKDMPESVYHWVVDTQNAERFVKAYKQDLQENYDYNLTAKELREYYIGEKVYKYEPLDLPCKLEGHDVYSYIDDGEWIKVGRLKKNADIDGEITLRLFVNTYKYVTEDSINRETDDPYFGVEVKKKDIL